MGGGARRVSPAAFRSPSRRHPHHSFAHITMQLSLLSLALLVQMPPKTFAWLHSYDMFMYDVQPVYGPPTHVPALRLASD